MKYISLVIVLALMIWTWCLANTDRPFKLEQHKNVEAGVESDIRSFIAQKYPTTKDLHCPQLYTEIVQPGSEMIAHFRCLTTGDAGFGDVVEQIFEGHLILKSTDGFQTWSETGGQIRSPEIRFRDGIQINRDQPNPISPKPVAPESTPGIGHSEHEGHQ